MGDQNFLRINDVKYIRHSTNKFQEYFRNKLNIDSKYRMHHRSSEEEVTIHKHTYSCFTVAVSNSLDFDYHKLIIAVWIWRVQQQQNLCSEGGKNQLFIWR